MRRCYSVHEIGRSVLALPTLKRPCTSNEQYEYSPHFVRRGQRA